MEAKSYVHLRVKKKIKILSSVYFCSEQNRTFKKILFAILFTSRPKTDHIGDTQWKTHKYSVIIPQLSSTAMLAWDSAQMDKLQNKND